MCVCVLNMYVFYIYIYVCVKCMCYIYNMYTVYYAVYIYICYIYICVCVIYIYIMNYILGAINPEQMINKQLSLSTLSAQAGGAATLAMTSSYMAGRRQCRRKMNQSTR